VVMEQKDFADWAARQKTALAAGGATTVPAAGATGETSK